MQTARLVDPLGRTLCCKLPSTRLLLTTGPSTHPPCAGAHAAQAGVHRDAGCGECHTRQEGRRPQVAAWGLSAAVSLSPRHAPRPACKPPSGDDQARLLTMLPPLCFLRRWRRRWPWTTFGAPATAAGERCSSGGAEWWPRCAGGGMVCDVTDARRLPAASAVTRQPHPPAAAPLLLGAELLPCPTLLHLGSRHAPLPTAWRAARWRRASTLTATTAAAWSCLGCPTNTHCRASCGEAACPVHCCCHRAGSGEPCITCCIWQHSRRLCSLAGLPAGWQHTLHWPPVATLHAPPPSLLRALQCAAGVPAGDISNQGKSWWQDAGFRWSGGCGGAAGGAALLCLTQWCRLTLPHSRAEAPAHGTCLMPLACPHPPTHAGERLPGL